ncbi:phosphate ABC transporter substrate-binding protein PstS [Candidatus Sumerlaeota bacterium]|nr:phosphate ABC transporter substrate-binding protein PstS [Candidatus Sumerlaeota bacterium]
MNEKNLFTLCLILILFPASIAFCQENVTELIGAGASFPYPLYSKWFDVYAKTEGIKVNYQSIGSGGGIQQLLNKTVDFGASDAFLSEEEKKKFEGETIHIPTALGGVAIIYNLGENLKLKMTPDILADIFLGKIKNWQDERIKKENPEAQIPKMPIIVAHRSDGSGTTFIFTDYLCKVSAEWKEKVGQGKSVKWPTGIGGKGNEGVAGSVKQLPGSIGYVEVIYAENNNLPYALLKNKAGNFTAPAIKSISEAANIALPEDLRVSITDTESPEGYPISGFTWLLVYKNQKYGNRSLERAEALQKLLSWCIKDAQKYNETLLYAPLPKAAQERAMKLVLSMKYGDIKLKEEKK